MAETTTRSDARIVSIGTYFRQMENMADVPQKGNQMHPLGMLSRRRSMLVLNKQLGYSTEKAYSNYAKEI